MKIIIGAGMGAAIGFTIGHFGRCSTGACPLTGNPVVSTIFWAVIGALVAGGL